MERSIRFDGEIVDQQTLLDGTRELTLEAAGADERGEAWTLTLNVRWPKESGGAIDEGDLSLTGAEGSSLYGTVHEGSAEDTYDDDLASEVVRLALTIALRSGDGQFAGFGGAVLLSGVLMEVAATLTAEIEAEPGGEE